MEVGMTLMGLVVIGTLAALCVGVVFLTVSRQDTGRSVAGPAMFLFATLVMAFAALAVLVLGIGAGGLSVVETMFLLPLLLVGLAAALVYSKTMRWIMLVVLGLSIPLAAVGVSFVGVRSEVIRNDSRSSSDTHQLAVPVIEDNDQLAADVPAQPPHVPLVEVVTRDIIEGGSLEEVTTPEAVGPDPDGPLSVQELYFDDATASWASVDADGPNRTTLPAWTSQTTGVASRTVNLHSARFSTLEEALEDCSQQLMYIAQQQLTARSPQLSSWWPTQPQLMSSGIVQRQCIATYPLKVSDEFTETVFEVTWNCTLEDEKPIDRLQAMWESQVIERRVYTVGIAVIALASLLALVSVWLQRSAKMAAA